MIEQNYQVLCACQLFHRIIYCFRKFGHTTTIEHSFRKLFDRYLGGVSFIKIKKKVSTVVKQ